MLFYFVLFINLNQIRWSDNILCCQTGVNSNNLRRWILSGGEAIAGAQLKQLKYHHSWWKSFMSIHKIYWRWVMTTNHVSTNQVPAPVPNELGIWRYIFPKKKKIEHAGKSNLNKSILFLQIHKNFLFWVLIFCKVWFSPSKTVTLLSTEFKHKKSRDYVAAWLVLLQSVAS